MNELISSNQPLTMSTREIASLLQRQHSNIKISAERLHKNGTIAMQGSRFEHNGNIYEEYLLQKRDSLILVAQNCPEFTAAIVDRWQELEQKQAPQIPQNFAEALQLAADQAKALELAAPKVAFVDNFVEVGTTKTLRETAKILKYPERKMIALLVEDKVLYRQSGNLLPYQNRHEQGLFDVKTGERNGHAYTQTRVTTKGVEWLAGRYASELMEDK
ncbi:Rha family regulatory protein [Vibrio phage 1.132.O._10N.222.49.F8]|nr:Rha family regulatory protein [Vibrio phage 1.132.O._10N.222.49.F8]